MALDKTQLIADILTAFKSTEPLKDPKEQQQKLAEKLAEAVDSYVRGGKVQGIEIDKTTFVQKSSVELK